MASHFITQRHDHHGNHPQGVRKARVAMSPMHRINTLLVEDHEMMLHGLTTYLKEIVPLVEVVATAVSADAAGHAIKTHPLDLIIMDIHLGSKPNGLDLTEELNKQFPEIAILIHSADDNIELVRRAQQAGARGYITKGAGVAIFKQAIDVVTNGMTYFQKVEQEVEELTETEKKVLRLLAQDKTDEDIAKKLNNIKPVTIRKHCCNIMSKLDLHSRLELRREARRRYPPNLDE